MFLEEQRAIPRDVFLNGPDNASGGRLRGAASEELDATEPDAKDSVELPPSASGGPFENNFPQVSAFWSVIHKNGWFGVGVGEFLIMEDRVRAWFSIGERDWPCDFKVRGENLSGSIGGGVGAEGGGLVEVCGRGWRLEEE